MPRVPAHSLETAPEQSRDALEAIQAKFGRIGNLHGHMAHAPAVIQGYVALRKAIDTYSVIDPATREAIALAVAAVDGCDYCQSAHTFAGMRLGFSEEQTVKLRDGDVGWDDKLAALIKLVQEIAGDLGEVSDATWQAALDAGWTDVELTEAGVHVAINLFTNYFNHMVQTDLDMKPAPGLAVEA